MESVFGEPAVISSKTEATPFTATNTAQSTGPLKISLPIDESFNTVTKDESSNRKNIVSRSADDNENSLDNDEGEKDKEKPQIDNSEEITQPPIKHQHGSHGPLGPVKHLLNTVRDRFHGNGGGPLGGIGAITSILGDRHEATTHESPIETVRDRTSSNSSTGLHVLEFLGTIFSQIWGFISNIPALFASSSSASISRRQ